MIDENSRYYDLEEDHCDLPDGRSATFVQQRLLPDPDRLGTSARAVVTDGDRLDTIAERELGNAEHFWRLCDANNIMNPWSLELKVGDPLLIPLPPGLDDASEIDP